MLNLDERNHELSMDIETSSQEYLRKVKERHLNPRKRKSEMEKIMKMFSEAKENSDTKVNLAIQTYELVDKHIRKVILIVALIYHPTPTGESLLPP